MKVVHTIVLGPIAAAAIYYKKYSGKNCYSGHGGVSIDTDDTAPDGLSESMCHDRCDADEECDCITMSPANGKCWKVKDCVPSEFEDSDDFVVLVKTPGPVSFCPNGCSIRPELNQSLCVGMKDYDPVAWLRSCDVDTKYTTFTFEPVSDSKNGSFFGRIHGVLGEFDNCLNSNGHNTLSISNQCDKLPTDQPEKWANLWSYDTSDEYQHLFVAVDDTYRCLDIPGGDVSEDVQMWNWDCNGADNQRFVLVDHSMSADVV